MIKGLFSFFIDLLIILVILHAVGSWIPKIRESEPYRTLDRFLSYLLDPIRRVLPPTAGLDLSPLVLLFLLYLVKHLFRL